MMKQPECSFQHLSNWPAKRQLSKSCLAGNASATETVKLNSIQSRAKPKVEKLLFTAFLRDAKRQKEYCEIQLLKLVRNIETHIQ